jgi:hypothetical protein
LKDYYGTYDKDGWPAFRTVEGFRYKDNAGRFLMADGSEELMSNEDSAHCLYISRWLSARYRKGHVWQFRRWLAGKLLSVP